MIMEEIKKNLYKIKLGSSIPIYVGVDEAFIRITQPLLKSNERFEEENYLGKGFPQEIIIDKINLKEALEFLGKLLIIENLK